MSTPPGALKYPFKPKRDDSVANSSTGVATPPQEKELVLSGVKGKTWYAGTDQDAPRDADGNFKHGWHWNMPYTVKRDLPDW